MLENLNEVLLAEPARLALAGICGAAALALALFTGARHPRFARISAGVLRVAALALIGVVLASPSVEARSERRFEPQGEWNLILSGDAQKSGVSFRESPLSFAARLRNALAEGKPPSRVEIFQSAQDGRYPGDLVRALGVPCTVHEWNNFDPIKWPMLGPIEGPAAIAPGEAFEAQVNCMGGTHTYVMSEEPLLIFGEVAFKLDNKEVQRRKIEQRGPIQFPRVDLSPGRHVISAELVGTSGTVIHRVGHVVRVGEPPKLLAVGVDDDTFKALEKLAPNFVREKLAPRELTAEKLREADVLLMPVSAGVSISSAQSRAIEQFVTNGGGLYVTGDGAQRVNRAYIESGFRDLLPVRLLEQRQEKPPDPPVKEEIGKSEVAAVSLAFVIDRSGSMDAGVAGGATRWQIATESIKQALAKLDPWDRAGVLSFTLDREWRPRPKVIAPFDRELISRDLRELKTDRKYDKVGYNTDIYKAVEEALAVMENEKSAVKVIVVLTDGGDRDNDDGTVRNHRKLAEIAISKGINIYAIGIGDGFTGPQPEAVNAKRTIKALATKEDFSYIAPDAEAAKAAPVVFVRAVEFAYKAYDDEMQRREREKEKRPVDTPKDPKLDVLEGKFTLALTPVGHQLFGMRELPDPAPKILKYTRCQLRSDAALALSIAPPEKSGEPPPDPVALALSSFGLGRVAFWASGSDAASLGDVAKWEDYPRLVAQTLRWLIPREDPQPRLVGGASTQGIGLIDPIEGAQYTLKMKDRDIALTLADGNLLPQSGELPEGDGEIIEKLGGQQRVIGDVYLAKTPAIQSRQTPIDDAPNLPPLAARAPEIKVSRQPATDLTTACLVLMLALMPIERLIRRRN